MVSYKLTFRVITNIVTALPSNQPRLKASGYVAEVSAMWKAMSTEEKIAATSESLKHLKDYRENKRSAHHNNNASAFHDAQSTLVSIKKEVKSIHYVVPIISQPSISARCATQSYRNRICPFGGAAGKRPAHATVHNFQHSCLRFFFICIATALARPSNTS
jgi:hypothetical protein